MPSSIRHIDVEDDDVGLPSSCSIASRPVRSAGHDPAPARPRSSAQHAADDDGIVDHHHADRSGERRGTRGATARLIETLSYAHLRGTENLNRGHDARKY